MIKVVHLQLIISPYFFFFRGPNTPSDGFNFLFIIYFVVAFMFVHDLFF